MDLYLETHLRVSHVYCSNNILLRNIAQSICGYINRVCAYVCTQPSIYVNIHSHARFMQLRVVTSKILN